MSESDEENCPRPSKCQKKSTGAPLQPLTMTTKRIAQSKSVSEAAKRAKISREADEEINFRESSAGVIKKLILTNFMCHQHFTISLNPRINFIAGANGSGKSAIQTALVVGLGGVASKTNRSSKVNGLIKHGCNFGSVAVFLANTGRNAYKPEKYGETIQIVRNITNSSSSYRIYDESGKLMSSSKREIDDILLKFKIHVTNPVTILNQDCARNFLISSKAENKYALFRKATLLEDSEDLLNDIASKVVENEQKIRLKRNTIKQVEEVMEKMAERVSLNAKLLKSKRERFDLETEFMWSKVHKQRHELNELYATKTYLENVKQNLVDKSNETKNELEELETKRNDFISNKEDILRETKKQEEIREKLKLDYRKKRKQFEEKCSQCEAKEKKIKDLKLEQENLKTTVDDSEKLDIEYKQKKHQATREKIELVQKLEKSESMLQILSGDLAALEKTSDHCKVNQLRLDRLIKDYHNQIVTNERQLQSEEKSDSLSMYDVWMPTLVAKINEAVKAGKFSEPPRGPLGRYLKVADEKWMYAIEMTLSSGLLRSFLVNNARDRKVLYEIMDRVIIKGPKPTVHCSRFQDKSRAELLPKLETTCQGYTNMLKALTISDNVVSNFLMDLRSIQRILLVDRDEDCRNFVYRDENIPPKCQMIINLAADQFLPGFRVYANSDSSRRAKILQKSDSDYRRNLEEDIVEKKEKINEWNREIGVLRDKYKKCADKMNSLTKNIRVAKSEAIETKRRIQELDNLIETEIPSSQAYLDEYEELTKELQQLETVYETLREERVVAERQMKDAKKAMNQDEQADLFARESHMNVEISKIEEQLARYKRRINEFEQKMKQQDQKVESLNARIETMLASLQGDEQAAIDLDVEPENVRSVDEIKELMDNLDCFIYEAEEKLGNQPIDLDKEFWKKKNDYKQKLKEFKACEQCVEKYKTMYKVRQRSVCGLKDLNSSSVNTHFQSVLRTRNYNGSLKIDHDGKKLEIEMAPIDGGKTFINTSSLSGGEKSYSTVAFLLALWSSMEIPFYSMDEYDVFMDAINRRTITQLLVDFANRKRDRQFIFLTPLDTSIIPISKDVQLHRVNKINN